MIPDIIVPFIVLPAVLILLWQSSKAQAQAALSRPLPPPLTQKQIQSNRRWAEFWDTIQAILIIAALIAAGLVFLTLIAFSFMIDFTIPPTTVIILLLVLILFKLK